MSTTSYLRNPPSQTEPPNKQPQPHQQAALRGAISAFPTTKKSTLPQNGSLEPSKPSGALSAAFRAASPSPNASPTTPNRPPLKSNASFAAERAHGLSSPSTQGHLIVPRSGNGGKGSSPAALAAARKSPVGRSIAPSGAAGPVPIEQTDGGKGALPPPGSVKDVHKWLEKLGTSPAIVGASPALKEAPASASISAAKGVNASTRREPEVTKVSEGIPAPKVVSERSTKDVNVHSPTPFRSLSVMNSSSTNTLAQQAEPTPDPGTSIMASVPAKKLPEGPVTISPISESGFVKPQAPPPRRSRPKEIPTDQHSTEAVRPISTRATVPLDRERRSSAQKVNQVDGVSRRSSHDTLLMSGQSPVVNVRSPSPQPFSTKNVAPHMTGDSLANAIVASNLASSRTPTPANPINPLVTLKSKPRQPFQHSQEPNRYGRSPSPRKKRQYTMRPASSFSEDEDGKKHSKNRFMRKHPHKHHEGSKKRWRDEITPGERKRYEGVWAANRGLLLQNLGMDDVVCNVVVRDIWQRSRLPAHVLEEVWELIVEGDIKTLGRAEFTVGMWLIDQRLKGRKLPVKVTESVWKSARGISGIRVPNIKH